MVNGIENGRRESGSGTYIYSEAHGAGMGEVKVTSLPKSIPCVSIGPIHECIRSSMQYSS